MAALPPKPTTGEAAAAMYGLWRLFIGQKDGLGYFAASESGFWRACWIVVLVLIAAVVLNAMGALTAESRVLSLGGLALAELRVVVTWFGYALAVYYVLPLLEREERYFDYIVPEFWSSIPLVALAILFSPFGNAMAFVLLGGSIWLRVQIIRLSLDLPVGTAIGLTFGAILFEDLIALLVLAD
jgi:hypothetical protein